MIGNAVDPASLDRALVDRFASDLDFLWPVEERAGPLGLAVSGGPDSLALLLLAEAAMPGEIAVASVDHGLRPQARAEVSMVERLCRELAIPFTALSIDIAPGNLQARAREARYQALAQWARGEELGALATAHHADDQAETLVMRLARGSGLSGLAGVRGAGEYDPRDDGDPVLVLRPLLGWRKAELEAIPAQLGIVPVRDPSNTDPRFERARVREYLADDPWLDPAALASSAGHLAEAWRAIEWYAQLDFEEMVEREDGAERTQSAPAFRYIANVPRIIQIETVRRIVSELGGMVTRAEAGRAVSRLWRGQNASLGGVLAVPGTQKMAQIGVTMRVWRFSPEPARRTH